MEGIGSNFRQSGQVRKKAAVTNPLEVGVPPPLLQILLPCHLRGVPVLIHRVAVRHQNHAVPHADVCPWRYLGDVDAMLCAVHQAVDGGCGFVSAAADVHHLVLRPLLQALQHAVFHLIRDLVLAVDSISRQSGDG